MRRDLHNSHHLATISYDGRFWDAYLELAEPSASGQPVRGRIAFSAADAGDVEPVRTTTIFIEDTAQAVLARAREFKTHQLVALLRSASPPEDSEDEGGKTPATTDARPAGDQPVEDQHLGDQDQGDAAEGP